MTTDRRHLEFWAAVLEALPRDISPEDASKWTQNREALACALHKALVPEISNNSYTLLVNYKRSVEDGIKAGHCDEVGAAMTSQSFPTKRRGKKSIVMSLLHFNRDVSTKEALCEISRAGYLPADLHELLTLGEKHPGIQREFPVLALGSFARGSDVALCSFPCLFGSNLFRGLDMSGTQLSKNLGLNWSKTYRFAVVYR